jgi:hypothetical protein
MRKFLSGRRPTLCAAASEARSQKTERRSARTRALNFRLLISGRQPPGGARRDRTDDLMLAKHALSQLSYGPGAAKPRRSQKSEVRSRKQGAREARTHFPISDFRLPISDLRPPSAGLVGLGGLEPPTSRLSSARSNQLSYKPLSEDRGRRTDRLICRPPSDIWKKERRRGRSPANAAVISAA